MGLANLDSHEGPVSPGFLGTQKSQFLDIQVVLEAFMANVSLRFWKPLAARGPGGLILSYIWKERQEGQRRTPEGKCVYLE